MATAVYDGTECQGRRIRQNSRALYDDAKGFSFAKGGSRGPYLNLNRNDLARLKLQLALMLENWLPWGGAPQVKLSMRDPEPAPGNDVIRIIAQSKEKNLFAIS